jgi:hypothetical protein
MCAVIAHLNVVIPAGRMALQFQINKHNLDRTAAAHRNSPETLPRVAIGLRIVGRDY